MTLQELHDHLAPEFPAYARKNLTTAVRVLARTLDCADPTHCLLEHFNRPLPTLYGLVERWLLTQGKKAHTVRNLKNYLSRLFRLAEAHQLFSSPSAPLVRRYSLDDRPCLVSLQGTPVTHQQGFRLSYDRWPRELQDAFGAFQTWATAPVIPGRGASLRKRLRTVEGYRQAFEDYFGFLAHVLHLHPVTFDHLFDLSLITQCLHWQINELYKRPTATSHLLLTKLLALTRQYRPLPALHADLMALKKTLPKPDPFYNKEAAWVSLATLTTIGEALWPRKPPQDHDTRRIPGLYAASRAGYSLMFRLWTYIPYRSRNMREMELDTNLYKDTQDRWRIAFRGEQLKVSTKHGNLNVFDLPFPDTLVPVLEDYLRIWRPVLLVAASQPTNVVFLTKHGTTHTAQSLLVGTKNTIYRYTGKHWHPHIIRTVWATEWIRGGGDFYTAAIMLNDRLETIIAKYTYLLDANVAEKSYRLLDERNGQGK